MRQRYTNSELVIVDDSDEPGLSAPAACERIVYIRLDEPTPLGTKMNIAIEAAHGDLLQKLDDDDYYHPAFLETAVTRLCNDASHRIVAWDCFLILFAGEQRTHFSGHGWAAGGTLSFTRQLWRRAAFRDIPEAVDRFFLIDHGYQILPVCAPEQYMLVRHGCNTWTKMDRYDTNSYLHSRPEYPTALKDIVGSDYEFYRSLEFTSKAQG